MTRAMWPCLSRHSGDLTPCFGARFPLASLPDSICVCAQEHGKDDVTGEELVRRDDDKPEVLRRRTLVLDDDCNFLTSLV